MSFIGRVRELAALEDAWKSDRSTFVPIYGRRRVGKSELIVRFMTGKNGIYYAGKRAPADAQIHEFLEGAARASGEAALAEASARTWKAAIELALSRAKKRDRKLILAFDEFQWMVEVSPELPSVLQELWDRFWSKQGDILLILCGSYLGFMEREVLGRRSPLFGRRTAQILLRPFGHIESAEFHPRLSVDDHARIYAICGGIPAYLLAFDARLSVEQNIINSVLEESAALAREPDFLLREELRDLVPYHAVMTALARGAASPSDLARMTGIEPRGLNYHLNTLMDLGYVERRRPLTDAPIQTRTVRYAIDDPLLRFWFRFVFPNQSLIRLLGPHRAFSEAIRRELDSYFGRCYERLCREALPLLYVRERVRSAFTVGEYWDRHVQIDVVSIREDNWTDLGECKWGETGPSLSAVATQLERKIGLYPNKRRASIGLRVFLRSDLKVRPKGGNVRVHTLRELYEA